MGGCHFACGLELAGSGGFGVGQDQGGSVVELFVDEFAAEDFVTCGVAGVFELGHGWEMWRGKAYRGG